MSGTVMLTSAGIPRWLLPVAWVVTTVAVLVIAGLTLHDAAQRRQQVLDAIDQRLAGGARLVEALLPPGYLERAARRDGVTGEEDAAATTRMETAAAAAGLVYLYATIRDGDAVRFLVSSNTPEERARDELTRHWDPYQQQPPELDATMTDGQPRFASYTDEWGRFRSAFVPVRLADGRFAACGADLELTRVEAALVAATRRSWFTGGAFIVIGLGLTAALHAAMRRLARAHDRSRMLAMVARVTDHGVAIADGDGRIQWVNQGMHRHGGRASHALVGQPLSLILPSQAGAVGDRGVAMEFGTDDGRWLLADLRSVARPDGSRAHWVLVLRDLTARKRMEDDLAHARAAAEAATRAKGEFLANMSHELRTPMHGVLGMTQLLLGTRLSPDQEQWTRTAHRSAEALLGLLNDLLDQTKIEAGRLQLDEQTFDLRGLLGELGDLFRPRLADGAVELVLAIAPEVPVALRGDALRLRQILINLVGNAVKFTRTGHIEVVVTGTWSEGRAALTFTVRDTGIGITTEQAARLFQPFAQADAGTARRFGGTGLGLALSRSLARMMGGDVQLQPSPGAGAVFTATVTLAAPTPPAPVEALLAGQRVLVADALSPARTAIAAQVRQAGGTAVEAADAAGALLALAEQPCAAAVIAARLPGLDGPGLAAAIRTDPTLGDPVLLLASGDPAQVSADGFAAVLPKPSLRVAAQVAEALRQPVPGGAARTGRPASPPPRAPRGIRVLLAEDNPVNQQVALAMLAYLGIRAELAGDGDAAVACWRQGGFDLILMDCQMPACDGYEATQRIRAAEAPGTRIPIIALTANAAPSDRERCLAAGMDEHLGKPFRQEALAALIDRFVIPRQATA
jgi:signal transduction histidine kinase/DNA-binding response OmpR family regulator